MLYFCHKHLFERTRIIFTQLLIFSRKKLLAVKQKNINDIEYKTGMLFTMAKNKTIKRLARIYNVHM